MDMHENPSVIEIDASAVNVDARCSRSLKNMQGGTMANVRRMAVCGLLCSVLVTTGAEATVVFDTGGDHSIATPTNEDVLITRGSRVTLQSGGSIEAAANAGWGGTVRVESSTLHVTGTGRITASGDTNSTAIMSRGGILRLADQARITGNVVKDYSPAALLDMSGRSVVDGTVYAAGRIRMRDQAAVLGDMQYNTTYTLDMLGGVIAGTAHMHGINGGYGLNMHAGSILGGVDAWNSYGVDLQMTGGFIDNGLRVADSASIDGEIRGGQINGGINIDTGGPQFFTQTNNLVISGGQFNADAIGYLLAFSDTNTSVDQRFSTLEIWGGQFGYQEDGLGLFLDNLVNFDIHGRDLTFENGWLTGWLLDGSWFNSALTFGSDYRGEFTIHNVPEPGTAGLMLLSIAGVFLAGRRRRIESDRAGSVT